MGWHYTTPHWLDGPDAIDGDGFVRLRDKGSPRSLYAIYYLKETLKAAGWVVEHSGDGTTYAAGSDLITSAPVFANAHSHVALRSPDSGHGICFQSNGTGGWRVKECVGTWDSGTPSATQTPAASGGEIERLGGGGDATPTYQSDNTWFDDEYMYGGADAAAPYGFWFGDGHSDTPSRTRSTCTSFCTPGLADAGFSALRFSFIGYTSNTHQIWSPINLGDANTPQVRTWADVAVTDAGQLWWPLGMITAYRSLSQNFNTEPYWGRASQPEYKESGVSGVSVAHATPFFQTQFAVGSDGEGTLGACYAIAWLGNRSPDAGGTGRVFNHKSTADVIAMHWVVMPWSGRQDHYAVDNLLDTAARNDGDLVIFGVDDFGGGDATPPTVTVVSPAPGATILPTDPVTVDVEDEAAVGFAELSVKYPGGATEVVVRDGDFRWPYTGTRTAIANGYRYEITRDGGWPRGNPRWEAVAIDTGGNRAA